MPSPGLLPALAGAVAGVAVLAAATGCGSVPGGGSGQASTPSPYTPNGTPEPAAATVADDPFAGTLTWPIEPDKSASVTGQLRSTEQVNIYDIGPVYYGDRLHVEVLGSGGLDVAVAVLDDDEDVLIANDDRSFYGGLTNPLAEAIILHHSESCYVAVAASPKTTATGSYSLQVLLTEDQPTDPPQPQRIYLNFDGADQVIIGSRPPVDVPVFEAASIDPALADYTAEIIENVLAWVREDYTGLNVEFYSSRAEPPPDDPYSTIHFGSFDPELLGVAENIDEYNLNPDQEAIIFVDTFGAFAVLNPSVEEMSQALANVASHEAGHLLGLYHTADPRGIMDVTANLRQLLADQTLARSALHAEVFALGYQDAMQTLVENVGGDLAAAKETAAARQAQRSSWYDAGSGPPARDNWTFSTCPRCLTDKARRHTRLGDSDDQPRSD